MDITKQIFDTQEIIFAALLSGVLFAPAPLRSTDTVDKINTGLMKSEIPARIIPAILIGCSLSCDAAPEFSADHSLSIFAKFPVFVV